MKRTRRSSSRAAVLFNAVHDFAVLALLMLAIVAAARADIATSPVSSNPVCVDSSSYQLSTQPQGSGLFFKSGSLFQSRANDPARNSLAHYYVATDANETTGERYLIASYVFGRLTKSTFAGPTDKNRPETGEFIADIKGVTMNVNGKPVTFTIMVRGALKNQPGYGNTPSVFTGEHHHPTPSPTVTNSYVVAMIDRNGDGKPDSVNKLSSPNSGPAVGDIAQALKQLRIQVGVSWINATGASLAAPDGTPYVNSNELAGTGLARNCLAIQIRIPFNVNLIQWAKLPVDPAMRRRLTCAVDGGTPQYDVTAAVNDGGTVDPSQPNQSSAAITSDPANGVAAQTPPTVPVQVQFQIRGDLPIGFPGWVGLFRSTPVQVSIYSGSGLDASTIDQGSIRICKRSAAQFDGNGALQFGARASAQSGFQVGLAYFAYFAPADLYSAAVDTGARFDPAAPGVDQPATLTATATYTVPDYRTNPPGTLTVTDSLVGDDPAHPQSALQYALREDATPPAVTITAAVNAFGWSNVDTIVQFTAQESNTVPGQSGLQVYAMHLNGAYRSDSGGAFSNRPMQGSQTIIAKGEGISTATGEFYDLAGNSGSPTPFAVQIDRTAPVTSYTITGPQINIASGWYTAPLNMTTATLVANDPTPAGVNGVSGVRNLWYRGPNDAVPQLVPGNAVFKTLGPFAEGRTDIAFWAEDYAGNVETQKTLSVRIDVTPPTSAATIPPVSGKNGWYVTDFDIPISASDDRAGVNEVSGVAKVHYKLDGVESVVNGTTATIQVRGDGTHSFEYWSEDVAGNVEASHHAGSVKIDSTAPVTTLASKTGTLGLNGWYVGGLVQVAVSAVDPKAAGVDSVSQVFVTHYRIDGVQLDGTSFTVSGDGTHSIEFWSEDFAGNVEGDHHFQQILIDSAAPITTVATDGSGPVSVTLSAFDPAGGSGVASTSYSVDGGPSLPYGGPFVVDGNGVHIVSFGSVDNAGNVEAAKYISFSVTPSFTLPAKLGIVASNGPVPNWRFGGGGPRHVTIFDPATLFSATLQVPNGNGIWAVRITRDGRTGFALVADRIYIIDNSTGRPALPGFIQMPSTGFGICFTPDEKYMIMGCATAPPSLCVVDVATRQIVSTFSEAVQPNYGPTAWPAGPDGSYPVTVSRTTRGTVHLSLSASGQLSRPDPNLKISGDNMMSVASPDGQTGIAVSNFFGSFTVFNLSDMANRDGYFPFAGATKGESATFSPGGDAVYLMTDINVLCMGFDPSSQRFNRSDIRFNVPLGQTLDQNVTGTELLALSPDGSKLFVSLVDKVMILDAATGAPVGSLDFPGEEGRGIYIPR